jgi:putative hydrolase of the HAD superfamily
MNSQMKNKIMAKDTVLIYNNYRKTFFATLKKERSVMYLLKYLRNKWIKTWVITDSSNFIQLDKLIHLWIDDKIDVMVSSEEAWMDKPHPSPFLLTMYKLDVKPCECVMVWDNIRRDIEGAQRLWIQWIRINRYHKPDEWIIPNYTVENTTQLYKLFKKIIG